MDRSAAIARSKALRQDIAEKLRSVDRNYAVFNTETQHRPGANRAAWLALGADYKMRGRIPSYSPILKAISVILKWPLGTRIQAARPGRSTASSRRTRRERAISWGILPALLPTLLPASRSAPERAPW